MGKSRALKRISLTTLIIGILILILLLSGNRELAEYLTIVCNWVIDSIFKVMNLR